MFTEACATVEILYLLECNRLCFVSQTSQLYNQRRNNEVFVLLLDSRSGIALNTSSGSGTCFVISTPNQSSSKSVHELAGPKLTVFRYFFSFSTLGMDSCFFAILSAKQVNVITVN